MKLFKIYFGFCFVYASNIAHAFNKKYFEDVCSNVTRGNYDEAKVRDNWMKWIQSNDVKVTCTQTTNCPGIGKTVQQIVLKGEDVGKSKHEGPCEIYFKKGTRTFGEVMKLLWGLQASKIVQIPPNFGGKHHPVMIQFSDFSYNFNIQLQGDRVG